MTGVAIVTGGTKGVGLAIARGLARAGHAVAVLYRSDEGAASDAEAGLRKEGVDVVAVPADVTDAAALDSAVTTVEAQLGPVSILVNNAGSRRAAPVAETSDADWSAVLGDNLDSAFRCIRRISPGMAARGYGRIVNLGSTGGVTGVANHAAYAAAKTGLIGLTRVTARELAPTGVTCNLVLSGAIGAGMTARITDEQRHGLAGMIPMARIGEPEELAGAVAYLCSPGAGYVTGAVLPVDGGLSMGW